MAHAINTEGLAGSLLRLRHGAVTDGSSSLRHAVGPTNAMRSVIKPQILGRASAVGPTNAMCSVIKPQMLGRASWGFVGDCFFSSLQRSS